MFYVFWDFGRSERSFEGGEDFVELDRDRDQLDFEVFV